jgi:hypothetical protein
LRISCPCFLHQITTLCQLLKFRVQGPGFRVPRNQGEFFVLRLEKPNGRNTPKKAEKLEKLEKLDFPRLDAYNNLKGTGNSMEGEVNMVNLELSEDEAKVLQNVLDNYHSHLDVEIHRTYKREFRDALKEREKFLANIIERLRKYRAQAA